jgi:ribosomal protein L11 methyltransferase
MPLSAPAIRATIPLNLEKEARRIADVLAESLDNNDATISVFEGAQGRWEIVLHFAELADEGPVRSLIALASDESLAAATVFEPVEATDWVAQSLEGLVPVVAGRFMVHGHHDRSRVRPNQIGIEIEAALAFGTGHHGTTRGCLILLDQVLRARKPRRILDLGTGTGVLAIAAAKATRQPILASDIDRVAVATAANNMRLNGAGSLVRTFVATGLRGTGFKGRKFDLVLANILANPLKRLALPMRHHLADGATVILSGLLPSQANDVTSAYRAAGLVLHQRLELEGWTSLLLGRA